jgi:outer membrane protein assembly factor BamB
MKDAIAKIGASTARAQWMVALVLIGGVHARGDDWPQWRGPARDGAWREDGILDRFPPDGVKVLWRAKIGWGYSSPIVADGRVYVTDSEIVMPTPREHVRCLDATTGEPVWTFTQEANYPDWIFMEQGHRGPTPTPIADAGRLYVLNGMGVALCLEAATGKVLWKRDVGRDFEMQVAEFGTDSSPLIEGDLLILLIGGKNGAGVVALDKNTGQEVWRAIDARRPYSSPIVITAGGARQLIVVTQQAVTSLDPKTGKTWWTVRNATTDYLVATPVHAEGLLLVSGLMLKLDPNEPAATVLWPEKLSKRVLSNTSTPLLQGDHVFSATSSGELVCLDTETGQEVWRANKVTEPMSGTSMHLTPHADRVFIYTERGELILARLSDAGYEELDRSALIEPTYPFGDRRVTWSPPAYANRCIFVRSDRELVCASLAAEP